LAEEFGPANEGPMPSARKARGDGVARWRELPDKHGKTTFVLNAQAADDLVAVAPNRCVTLDFIRELTLDQLHLFIDTSVKADGRVMSSSTTMQVTQSDPRRLDAIELAAILAGYATNRYANQHQGFHWHTIHTLTIGNCVVPNNKELDVACPQTRNGFLHWQFCVVDFG